MGGMGSKIDGIIGRSEYAWWEMEYVRCAYDRAVKLKPALATTEAQTGRITLSRREFVDVFTDYNIIKGDTWLSLSLPIFRAFEIEDTGTIDCLEIFLMLGLFCDGDQKDQLGFCFEIFDTDHSNNITLDEMIHFFQVLCRAAYKVGITIRVPAQPEIVKTAKEMFEIADIDGEDDISKAEFVSWCGSHVISQRLLASFKKVKHVESKQVDKRKLHKMAPGLGEISEQGKQKFKAIEQAKQASHKVMELLSQETKFDVHELRNLMDVFKTASDEKMQLKCDTFIDVMTQEYPSLSKSALVDLFNSFDADGSGDIDVKEFTMGLAKIAIGSTQDKLRLVFDVLDVDGGGEIGIGELLSLVQQNNEESMALTRFTSEIVNTLDKDGDGTISKDEFTEAVREQPMLQDCFAGRSLPQLEKIKPDFYELQRAEGFGFATLQDLWDKTITSGDAHVRTREMTMPAFRKFMTKSFGAAQEHTAMMSDLFIALDADGSGSLGLQELFYGLSQVVRGTKEQKAAFYFSLYDMDNSGEMDKDEIIQMLMSTQDAVDRTSHEATRLLQDLDEDGNGKVTYEEFENAAEKSPQLMECFGSIFGTNIAGGGDDTDRAQRKAQEIARLLCGERGTGEAEPLPDAVSPPASPEGGELQMGAGGGAGGGAGAQAPSPDPAEAQSRAKMAHIGLRKLRRQSLGTQAMIVMSLQKVANDKTRTALMTTRRINHSDQELRTQAVKAAFTEYRTKLADKVVTGRRGIKDQLDHQKQLTTEINREAEENKRAAAQMERAVRDGAASPGSMVRTASSSSLMGGSKQRRRLHTRAQAVRVTLAMAKGKGASSSPPPSSTPSPAASAFAAAATKSRKQVSMQPPSPEPVQQQQLPPSPPLLSSRDSVSTTSSLPQRATRRSSSIVLGGGPQSPPSRQSSMRQMFRASFSSSDTSSVASTTAAAPTVVAAKALHDSMMAHIQHGTSPRHAAVATPSPVSHAAARSADRPSTSPAGSLTSAERRRRRHASNARGLRQRFGWEQGGSSRRQGGGKVANRKTRRGKARGGGGSGSASGIMVGGSGSPITGLFGGIGAAVSPLQPQSSVAALDLVHAMSLHAPSSAAAAAASSSGPASNSPAIQLPQQGTTSGAAAASAGSPLPTDPIGLAAYARGMSRAEVQSQLLPQPPAPPAGDLTTAAILEAEGFKPTVSHAELMAVLPAATRHRLMGSPSALDHLTPGAVKAHTDAHQSGNILDAVGDHEAGHPHRATAGGGGGHSMGIEVGLDDLGTGFGASNNDDPTSPYSPLRVHLKAAEAAQRSDDTAPAAVDSSDAPQDTSPDAASVWGRQASIGMPRPHSSPTMGSRRRRQHHHSGGGNKGGRKGLGTPTRSWRSSSLRPVLKRYGIAPRHAALSDHAIAASHASGYASASVAASRNLKGSASFLGSIQQLLHTTQSAGSLAFALEAGGGSGSSSVGSGMEGEGGGSLGMRRTQSAVGRTRSRSSRRGRSRGGSRGGSRPHSRGGAGFHRRGQAFAGIGGTGLATASSFMSLGSQVHPYYG